MKGDKETSVGCSQLKERMARRKAGLTLVDSQSVGFAFAVVNEASLIQSVRNEGSLRCEG